LSLFAIIIAGIAWFRGGVADVDGGMFHTDALVWYIRGLSLVSGFLLTLVLWNQIDDGHAAEAHACLLAIMTGVNLVAAANDLVSLFLALELVSIPTYVLLYLPRRDRTGGEATLKYFLLSVFSSAILLYGMSWLYGVAGTTKLTAIAEVIANRTPHTSGGLLSIALALLVAGLCFRIAAVPFHFYAPDVFQGTTAANAAMLSLVPKVVGFVALMKIIPLTGAMDSMMHWVPSHAGKWMMIAIAVVTMFVGNLLALRQRHLYRLMAYSSIAHAGYMLIGLVVGNTLPVGGREAILFYLATYALMTIGVFALFSIGGKEGQPLEMDGGLRGLSRRQPFVAFLLAVCLFSLTGLPPTAGFLGKLNLFLTAWSDETRVGDYVIGHYLAGIMAVNAAIAAYYYLRLVALMFLEAPFDTDAKPVRGGWAPWFAGVGCAIATIAIFVSPQWLWDSIR
jgi:NADH-quinone oxidoreductase subunit N